MVMYEIWSLGHKPFEEWDVQEVKKDILLHVLQTVINYWSRN